MQFFQKLIKKILQPQSLKSTKASTDHGHQTLPDATSDFNEYRVVRRSMRNIRTVTLDCVIKTYKAVRQEHEKEAKTARGLCKLGYGWIYWKAKDYYGVRLHALQLLAGFNDSNDGVDKSLSIEYAKELFYKVKGREGNGALNPEWLASNGFCCLVDLVTKTLGMTWSDFIAYSIKGDKIKEPSQLPDTQSPYLVNKNNPKLLADSGAGVRLEDIYRSHAQILAEVGAESALHTGWLNHNNHTAIYHAVASFGLDWKTYLILFGAYLMKNRPDLIAHINPNNVAAKEAYAA